MTYHIVASACMDGHRQICRPFLQDFVVHPNVHVQLGFWVYTGLFHTRDHRVRAEKGKVWFVELNVAAAEIVQLDDLFTICLDQVSKVFLYKNVKKYSDADG